MRKLVAIDLPGGPGWVDALRRAWDAGDAVLPVDQRLAPAAKVDLLRALGAGVVVGAGGRSALAGGRPVDDGDALVMATSGTTGTPKGVVLTHAAVAASAAATSGRLAVDPTLHRWLACLPLNHVGGLGVLTRSLLTGTPCEVLPRFDAAAVAQRRSEEVLVSLVPTALSRIGAQGWRAVVLGGSAPPGDLAPNVVSTYGMTETCGGVVYDGAPLDGMEVRVDPATSEISLRGPMLLRTYRDRAAPLDPDGWLATGDSGAVDAGGHLCVTGRLSEMIVTGGENVWPAVVEAILSSHPGVAEAGVAGRPDPEWGERVVAWVVPADPQRPPRLEDLRDHVRERLAAYAAPRELVVVDSLPKTSIGKLRRGLLP